MTEKTSIVRPGPGGGGNPSFLIKVGTVYYFTTGTWKYDINEPGITPQQTADCLAVAQEFAKAQAATGTLEAVEVKPGDVVVLCATWPAQG